MELNKSLEPSPDSSQLSWPHVAGNGDDPGMDKLKMDMRNHPEMFEKIYQKAMENFRDEMAKQRGTDGADSGEFKAGAPMAGGVRSNRSLSSTSSNSSSPPPLTVATPVTSPSDLEKIREHVMNAAMSPETLLKFQTQLTTHSPEPEAMALEEAGPDMDYKSVMGAYPPHVSPEELQGMSSPEADNMVSAFCVFFVPDVHNCIPSRRCMHMVYINGFS